MKLKFENPKTKKVTFNRDGQKLDFELTAPPAGFFAWLRTVFPPPHHFVNGKQVTKDSPDYDTLFSYIWIAKALEPSGVLETDIPEKSAKRNAWNTYAKSVRSEFREAHFSEGDVATLLEAMAKLEKTSSDEDGESELGNF